VAAWRGPKTVQHLVSVHVLVASILAILEDESAHTLHHLTGATINPARLAEERWPKIQRSADSSRSVQTTVRRSETNPIRMRRTTDLGAQSNSTTRLSNGTQEGAQFTVRRPFDSDANRTATEPASEAQPLRRILIVEDNVDAAETLRDVLEFGGHEVLVAFSAREGLEHARSHHPDLVLCDIGLPGMDGYEFAREFRSNASLSDCILVALTGYAMPEDLQRACGAGFDRHLAKPASFEKINEMLKSLPEIRGAQPNVCSPDPHPKAL